jgi:23S rRNA (adenine2503-C2)-methyltransferase
MDALTDHSLDSLQRLLIDWGYPPVHSRRLLHSLYRTNGDPDYASPQLPRSLRDRLSAELPPRQAELVRRHVSRDGTIKLVLGYASGGTVESVLMPAYHDRRAAGCISSQIGCAMGCDFCATATSGLVRNLTPGEIVEQFLHLRHEAEALGRRLSTLVFMGQGEPLHNFDAVVESIRRFTHPALGNLGPRAITVSTVGVVPAIDRLAAEGLGVHLALSLHAPDDGTRSGIVPLNRKYPVADVMAAARRYQDETRRIVNVEYCLLAGVNDSDDHAAHLAKLMDGFRAHVNVIPHNPVSRTLSGRHYAAPPPERVERFLATLCRAGVAAHRRRQRGDDITAACGQLRQTSLPVLSD